MAIYTEIDRPDVNLLSSQIKGITNQEDLRKYLLKYTGTSVVGPIDPGMYTPEYLTDTFNTLAKYQPETLASLERPSQDVNIYSALLPELMQRTLKKEESPGSINIDFGLGIQDDPTGELSQLFREAREPKQIGGYGKIINTATGEVIDAPGAFVRGDTRDTSGFSGFSGGGITEKIDIRPGDPILDPSYLDPSAGMVAGMSPLVADINLTGNEPLTDLPNLSGKSGIYGQIREGGVMPSSPYLPEVSPLEDITRFLPGGGGGAGSGVDAQIQKLLGNILGGEGPGAGQDYSYLLQPQEATAPGIPGAAPSPAISGGGGTPEMLFQDYLKQIGAPSTVEQVQQQIENQQLQQILGDIERQTAQDVATAKSDFGERGLLGPGRTSDIAENALAQIKATGGRTGAQARTQLLLSQLGRQAEKEKTMREAYGKRYETGAELAGKRELLGTELAFKGAESKLDRLQKGQITYAKLKSTDKRNMLNQLINAVIEGKKLSQADEQFVTKLRSDVAEKEKDRQADLALGKMRIPREEDTTLTDIKSGLDIFTDLLSIGATFL